MKPVVCLHHCECCVLFTIQHTAFSVGPPHIPPSFFKIRERKKLVLTVIALAAWIWSHGAITGETFPLLITDALISTGIFLASGTWSWRGDEEKGVGESQEERLMGQGHGGFIIIIIMQRIKLNQRLFHSWTCNRNSGQTRHRELHTQHQTADWHTAEKRSEQQHIPSYTDSVIMPRASKPVAVHPGLRCLWAHPTYLFLSMLSKPRNMPIELFQSHLKQPLQGLSEVSIMSTEKLEEASHSDLTGLFLGWSRWVEVGMLWGFLLDTLLLHCRHTYHVKRREWLNYSPVVTNYLGLTYNLLIKPPSR